MESSKPFIWTKDEKQLMDYNYNWDSEHEHALHYLIQSQMLGRAPLPPCCNEASAWMSGVWPQGDKYRWQVICGTGITQSDISSPQPIHSKPGGLGVWVTDKRKVVGIRQSEVGAAAHCSPIAIIQDTGCCTECTIIDIAFHSKGRDAFIGFRFMIVSPDELSFVRKKWDSTD